MNRLRRNLRNEARRIPPTGRLEDNPEGVAPRSPRLLYSATLVRRIALLPNPNGVVALVPQDDIHIIHILAPPSDPLSTPFELANNRPPQLHQPSAQSPER